MESSTTPIDVIITSYNRIDLLDTTLKSFFSKVKFPFMIHVYDDYGTDNMNKETKAKFDLLVSKYPEVNFIFGKIRKGQVLAIDELMKHVTSKYFIKLEEDWECLDGDFLNESVSILDKHEKCVCVWLRGLSSKDVNYHPIKFEDDIWKFETEYQWRGFSWGASVHRLSDYTLIGRYSNYTFFMPRKAFKSEKEIGELYYKKGYFASSLIKKYFVHIGDGQGIRN